ncbi:hypothetical protein AWH63_11020 [Marinobacter sp. C18]|uniref:hypothetical protein n=1 Tax=Marinobacter sp. C18 TaxID=1772288 RepID=UPI0009680159|nr:hypothetical protein [Marinobacter sp. C18]OLF82063.1 hypothetical protein AWH63_11020 [Marinobacter sp. C18]
MTTNTQTESHVPFTLAQAKELLMASQFVSWENEDFTTAQKRLEKAVDEMERGTASTEKYEWLLKMPDDTFQITNLLPNVQQLTHSYGFLIAKLESVTLTEWADRITAHYDNVRVSIEAGEIKRWVETMRFCEDSIVNFGALPMEFEYADGVYDYDDILKILGEPAITYLLADQVA